MSEATLNPPSLEQINRDLAQTVSEEMAKNEKLRAALMRINVSYREASGLPLHVQAYCMRSEAKVALGLESEENWVAELAQIRAAHGKGEN